MEDIKIQSKEIMSSKEIVARARKFYKENFKKLWPLYILGGLGGVSFGGGSGNPENGEPSPYLNFLSVIPWWVWILIGILLISISIFLFISRIALLKSISDTNKDKFISVKDSYKKALSIFWSFIFLTIIISLSVLGAMILLIIPGIILSGYLVFSTYELIDKQKKGFSALLGSWALISGHWWTLLLRSIIIGLRVFVRIALYSLIVSIPALLLIVLGAFFNTEALLIIGIVLGVLGFICLVMFYGFPLIMIAMFEFYYSFCEVKELNGKTDEVLEKMRKSKLKVSMIIGIVAVPLIIFAILTAVILVNMNQDMSKAKNNTLNNSISTTTVAGETKKNTIISIVKEMKQGATFPYKIDEVTTLTDVTAESNSIRYHYVVSGDMSNVTNDVIKKSIVLNACGDKDAKNMLEQNINIEYSYTVKETQQTFFVTLSKIDCL